MKNNDFFSFINYNEIFYEEFIRAIKQIKDELWPERSNYLDIGCYVTKQYVKFGKDWEKFVGCIQIKMTLGFNEEYTEYIPANVVLENGVENYINKVKADREKAKKKIRDKKRKEENEKKQYQKLKEKYEGTTVEIEVER